MEFQQLHADGVAYLVSPVLSVPHGFGVRPSPGVPPPEPEEMLRALGRPDAVALRLRQVHGRRVVAAREVEAFPVEADGVVTGRPGLAPVVRTADCVPVLLQGPEGRSVGAVHAGWRGIDAGVLEAGVEKMAASFGAPAREMLAAVGPSIGPCCYEVGREVAERFDRDLLRPGFSPKPHLDLWEAVRRRLEAAGLPSPRISLARMCTVCDPDRFPSHRRDGGSGERLHTVVLPHPW